MSWLQLSIDTTDNQAPLVELLFENLGALSVTLSDAGEQPLLEPAPNQQQLWHYTRITGLFDDTQDPGTLRNAINHSLKDLAVSLHIERLEDKAWERTWLEHFVPMKFGRHLWICPAGQQPEANDAIIVNLDPGLAFGTGTHPTTALCLEWLDGLNLKHKTIIDYGCGSGILAIAALKLGAANAIAIDHDPQALEATLNNAWKNSLSERLTVFLPEEYPGFAADLLIANILAGPLVELAPTFRRLIKPHGRFALSGILTEQTGTVVTSYMAIAELDPPQQKGEWILISGQRH